MKKFILLALLVLSARIINAQLITVEENSVKPALNLNLNNKPIADINSKLTIRLSKDQLLDSISQGQNSNPELAAKLKSLLYILESQQEILKLLTPAISGDNVNLKNLSIYSELMSSFYSRLSKYPVLRQSVDSLFRVAVDKNKNHTLDHIIYPTLQSYVIKNLSAITDTIMTDIQNSQGLNKINIKVVAFLSTKTESDRKVHIENFDNYSEGEFYDVPKWVTSFSQDDMKAFNQVTQVSKDLNTEVANNFSNLNKLIPTSLNSYSCFSNLLTNLQKQVMATTSQTSNEMTVFITATEKQLDDMVKAIQSFQLLKNNQNVNTLQQFIQTSNQFLTLANNLPDNIAALKNQLSVTAMKSYPKLDTLNIELASCLGVLKTDVTLVSGIYSIVNNLLQPFQTTANSAQKVSGNAFSFNINQLPKVGYIDLKKTGKRRNGDEIVIKLIYQTQDDVTKNQPGQTLENDVIQLQQINFYSESNIGVILACPIGNNSNVTIKNKFQFAPAGSFLLKWGSRKCQLWNDISPGFGVNISTPDFNLDGSPDICYGVVVSLFQNILCGGLSYNTTTSSPFWFFGLSLPFSTIGLPLGNVQTQKN